MTQLRQLRQDILILLLFWGPETTMGISDILQEDYTVVLAALFVLEDKEMVVFDNEEWSIA